MSKIKNIFTTEHTSTNRYLVKVIDVDYYLGAGVMLSNHKIEVIGKYSSLDEACKAHPSAYNFDTIVEVIKEHRKIEREKKEAKERVAWYDIPKFGEAV